MKQAKIISIGPKAIDSHENILILFGEEVTDTLREFSIIQELDESEKLVLKTGSQIKFNDQTYVVEQVGASANEHLNSIGHISVIFDKSPKEDLLGSSSVYVSPYRLPDLSVGDMITYVE
ncbi:PTS glucitol/sorbitol transporter subunit IIA [Vagococcus humatus]|uniref:PTS sugar transporter subunit IIA n=1 Tax=Vagococcus humatus TaxID=1889241 RepID=A0A3S0AXQ4_9ENTE|nr:PTS glucitol/sorbitol transporter subunit IIA [Vagococcus humatus]RST89575.1 PTS sugar transporter subunit IIA [Vagococcus humatus]